MKKLSCLLLFLMAAPAFAQIDARMMRFPDVSATQITFVYAGDIWVAPIMGGVANRLSSPEGEETFPRFSPDGSQIAFSGNYDGNTDIYVLPSRGGAPEQLTHHPMNDRLLGWHPDGTRVLYASSMESGRQRFSQLYLEPVTGGMPTKLPVPYGEFGEFSPDGKLLAYMPKARDFRNWKHYRGGMAPDIWLFDLEKGTAENITDNPANDSQPMWHGRTLYFLSDRGPEQHYNLWAYDLTTKESRQITRFTDFDIRFPASGPNDIVFEAGGRLYLLNFEKETYQPVNIEVVTDRASLKPRLEKVSDLIQHAWISPSGKRAVFEARGDLFSVPAEHGVVRNLTHSPAVAERTPAWSPDGTLVAYWSDRSGEYELTLAGADGEGGEIRLTSLGAGFRYQPFWSPDSRKLAFIDQTMTLHIFDRDTGKLADVDQGLWLFQGGLENFSVNWSADSRWLAYSRGLTNRNSAIFLYDVASATRHQVTSGFYDDSKPVFDPNGDYLYFRSGRSLSPDYSDLQGTWIYANTSNLVAVALRPDVASPLAPRDDEEEKAADKKEDEQQDEETEETKASENEKPVEITLDGFERRLVVLPPNAGNYTDLQAAKGKLFYRRLPRTGSDDEDSPVVFYDLKEREEKTVLDDSDGFLLSSDGKKILTAGHGAFAIVDAAPNQKMDKTLATGDMEMTVDPVAEWRQIFNDTWRFERDFFYDKGMHGVDWVAMRKHYGDLLDDAVTRWDVNYVLGELIAELNSSHTYRGGGDTERADRRGVGLLGVDWSLENGAFRIARIVDGAPWDSEVRSPLALPGVDVKEGDYVLAVNGRPMDTTSDPWAAFAGLAGKTVALTVNDRPSPEGAREVLIETLKSETRLRHLAWIEANRKRVDEATDGRVGYVYVPNTGTEGQTELVRQFRAQFNKEGLVIDERFNSGGQIPDRFIELLNRPPLAFWSVRDGHDWQWPPVAHFGPQVMLINGWSGSGGDAFPDYFRKAGLGPLIGTRTWGGLIGISGAPALIDGGGVTVPTFRMYNPDGTWFAEGHGVDPDIKVVDDPAQLAKGVDPQLERAIEEVMRQIAKTPAAKPARPPYEDRSRAQSVIRQPKG